MNYMLMEEEHPVFLLTSHIAAPMTSELKWLNFI